MTGKALDGVQEQLAEFAVGLTYDDLAPADVDAVRLRLVDTLAALCVGLSADVCRQARTVAAAGAVPDGGAAVAGAGLRSLPQLAAFANGTAARVAEMNDVYVSRLGLGTHPSDVIMPVVAAAEAAGATGRELVTGIALAYEVYMELADRVRITGYDAAMLSGIGVALGAAKVMRLTPQQVRHAIALVVVPHNPLVQTRRDQLSSWKAAAAGQAGHAGVWAAVLARAGMEGPHLPFEGRDGWARHVADGPVSFELRGGGGRPFRVRESMTKPRAACQNTISSILAAEAAHALLPEGAAIERAVVSTYGSAKAYTGTGAERWNPLTRETADHSIPYVVAAALLDGTVGPRQFDDDRLWDPELRALMARVEVQEEPAYTAANEQWPQEHLTSVAVETADGGRVVGHTGREHGDLRDVPPMSAIVAKLRTCAADVLPPPDVDRMVELAGSVETLHEIGPLTRVLASAGQKTSAALPSS